jgi:hypothetical protein
VTALGAEPVFKAREILLALFAALVVKGALFLFWIYSGAGSLHVRPDELAVPKEIPIAVKPVIDELPLLKLGGKKKAKLPEMWKKQAPVQRFEERSAPSAKADKSPQAIPSSKLAEIDATPPPPDAEVAKEVDQELLDATPDAAPTVEGEGAADGVKEGTEADPLKAHAVSQYRAKILAWFNARFQPPSGEVPCEELKKLRASVVVQIGSERNISGYSMARESGNTVFDARVRATMDRLQGEQLPPPPPLYPDILSSSQGVTFSGQGASCE